MPEVSIVILTFNSIKTIAYCLDSVFSQDYQGFEVIIVDNGSKDNTTGFIKGSHPGVILIENKENGGACRGRNQGVEAAGGQWILTLDADVVLTKDFLEKIMAVARSARNDVGSFQPKILFPDKMTIYSCGIYVSKLFSRFYDIGKNKLDAEQFNAPRYIFGACSAAALYRRKMLDELKEKAGYFDERFFFLLEDVDLSWRAQSQGYKTLYVPESVCYHSGDSSKTPANVRQFFSFRNRGYLILKNDSGRTTYKNFLALIFYDLPRLFFLYLFNPYTMKAIRQIRCFKKVCRFL